MSGIPPNYVQYPRSARPDDPFYRPPGVYFDAISDAWRLIGQDWASWIGATLVAGVIFVVTYIVLIVVMIAGLYGGSLEAMSNASQALDFRGNLISLPFGGLFQMTLYGPIAMGVRKLRGQSSGLGDVFLPWTKFGSMYLLFVAIQILQLLGTAACIIPSFFVIGVTVLSPLILLFNETDPLSALKTGFEAMKPYAWHMFGLIFVLGLILALGVLFCGFGLLIAAPIYSATIALHFHYFFPPVSPVQQPVDFGRPMA